MVRITKQASQVQLQLGVVAGNSCRYCRVWVDTDGCPINGVATMLHLLSLGICMTSHAGVHILVWRAPTSIPSYGVWTVPAQLGPCLADPDPPYAAVSEPLPSALLSRQT
jgi:hypothetical protein